MKHVNDLYNSISDYTNKLNTLKTYLFTNNNLTKILSSSLYQHSSPSSSSSSSPVNINNSSPSPSSSSSPVNINNSLILLENNILRRILHNKNDSAITTIDDAYDVYKSNIKNNIDGLIGYVNFNEKSPDYNLLQTTVCGNNICNEGIGAEIKNLNIENFISFVTNLKPFTDDYPNNENNYTNFLLTFTTKVATYNVSLAMILNGLTYQDPIWNNLKNLIDNVDLSFDSNIINIQSTMRDCPCLDALGLNNTTNLTNLLSALNYMRNQSNGDPTSTINTNISRFNNYLIISYTIISFIVFLITYRTVGKPQFIIAYIILLATIVFYSSIIMRYVN